MLLTAVTLLTSVVTLVVMWLLGKKDKRGWLLSIANQSLWFWSIWLTKAWGFIPLEVMIIVIAVRSYRRWSHDG